MLTGVLCEAVGESFGHQGQARGTLHTSEGDSNYAEGVNGFHQRPPQHHPAAGSADGTHS